MAANEKQGHRDQPRLHAFRGTALILAFVSRSRLVGRVWVVSHGYGRMPGSLQRPRHQRDISPTATNPEISLMPVKALNTADAYCSQTSTEHPILPN
jgi:hypothetical protein